MQLLIISTVKMSMKQLNFKYILIYLGFGFLGCRHLNMTLANVGHFWKSIRGISDLNGCCKTRLGKRIPQGRSRGLGNRTFGYSFITKRVKSIFPCYDKYAPTITYFSAFSRFEGTRRVIWTVRLLVFIGRQGLALSLYLYLPQSVIQ